MVGEGMFHEGGRWAVGHGTGDNRIVANSETGGFMRTATQEHDGCDHTSTNAPDPHQNSVVKRAWAESSTRIG